MNINSDIDHDDEIEGEPLLIGLTGGIGSGKSTVAKIFEQAGFPIINADKEARFVMEHDETVKHALISVLLIDLGESRIKGLIAFWCWSGHLTAFRVFH